MLGRLRSKTVPSMPGVTNLDWRSFLHNEEVMAVVLGQEFGVEQGEPRA